jgi:hypothetical protein
MPNIIQHKRSSTPGNVPLVTGLAQGELGINIGDGKLYTKNSSNSIINLGITSISGTSITPSSGLFSNSIGIGTTTPSGALHVAGLLQGNTVGTTGIIVSNSHASQSANGQNHTSLYVNPTFLTNSSNLNNTYGLLISPSSSGQYGTTNSYGLYVNANTLVTGTILGNYAAVFMGGNVGIGTSIPSSQLHVVGSGLFTSGLNISNQTASTIASFDANKNIVSLSIGTYPSLIELSYVKDVTSSIQTQINSKQNTLTNPVTGTGTSGKISKWSSASALTDSILSESSTVIYIAGSFNGNSDDSYLSFDAGARRIGMTKKTGFTGKFTYGSGSSFAIAQSNISTIEAANTFTDRLVIDPSGNVGIGTAAPGYKLQVAGSFGATTKSFRIDHPSKSGWNLEYGSLESPYHGIRLTGRDKVIKGVGIVSLPVYLKDLIHDDTTLNIQITNIKHGKIIYVDKIDLKNDRFIVKADRSKSLGELEFFWTLSGVRKDVDNLVVEKRN